LFKKLPATYETVAETVVVQEAGTELVTIPATFETVTETVVVQEASTDLVTIPATYETVTDVVVVTPQSVVFQLSMRHIQTLLLFRKHLQNW